MLSLIEEQLVVSASDIGFRISIAAIAVALREDSLFVRRRFLLGKEWLAEKFLRALKGSAGGIRPDALQIGVAIGGVGRSPVRWSLRLK